MPDLNPFKDQDVDTKALPDGTDSRFGSDFFKDVNSLQVGYGSQVLRADQSGIWLGASKFADAPFSVDMQGNLIANSVTLSGYLQVGQALGDTQTSIGSGGLSAITANIGAITAGTITGVTITGGTLQTATTGRRVKISSSPANKIEFYDASTLYGVLEADKVGTDGYINLIAQDDGAGLSIYTGVGASAFSSVQLFGQGGGFAASGNSGSNAFAGIYAGSGSANVQFSGGGGSISFYLDDGSGSEIGVSCHWRPEDDAQYDVGISGARWRDGRFSRDLYVGDDFEYQGINQGINYFGYVSGTSLTQTNSSFSVSNPSTGNYTISHSFGTTNYIVLATALRGSGAGAYNAKIQQRNSNDFRVTIFDDTGTLVASDFMFIVMKIS